MAWTPAIPQGADFISQSQPLIFGNFQALDVWAKEDHSNIGAAGQINGKHFKISFVPLGPPNTAPIPNPLFPPGYPGLFGANPANLIATFPTLPLTGFNEIFLQANSATNRLTPLTASLFASAAANTEGYFYLPGSQLVKYGTLTIPAPANEQTYTYLVNAADPVFQGPPNAPLVFLNPFFAANVPPVSYSSWCTASSGISFNYAVRNNTGANVGGTSLFWVAIGLPL